MRWTPLWLVAGLVQGQEVRPALTMTFPIVSHCSLSVTFSPPWRASCNLLPVFLILDVVFCVVDGVVDSISWEGPGGTCQEGKGSPKGKPQAKRDLAPDSFSHSLRIYAEHSNVDVGVQRGLGASFVA